ncbi:hypothetical protein [Ottowia testudinis]|uniref:Lipoprotein n=1 Tax=Ottowia testudinis TaxID=2816950 RepID=A0A975CLS5_9BURK|nr:hypothetical protein [Ottowia testudinis]QTD46529.1 hypothetical protein J1M35_06515 [Ottowia testudinis]
MQNSKRLVPALILTLTLIQSGCATADQAPPSPKDQPLQTANSQESPPVIKTTILGWSPLKKDQPLPPIHVEFEDNPELVRVMQASLAAAGFPVAPDASTAEFRVLFSSYFSFDRSRTKRQTVSVGKLLADQRMASTLSSMTELGTRGYRDVNLSANLLLLPSFGVPGVVTGLTNDILEIISDLSGLRGGLNKALVGDERGVCIPIPPGACDRWKIYSQRVTVKAAMFPRGGDAQEINLSVSTEHERLMPVELFMDAQAKIVAALLPEGFQRTIQSKELAMAGKES